LEEAGRKLGTRMSPKKKVRNYKLSYTLVVEQGQS